MQVCSEPGCPTLVDKGRCPQHQLPPRPGRQMPRDWKQIRRRILQRDNHTCHWCGDRATSADHLVPVSKGGPDDDSNLVASCWPCNRSRGNRAA